MTRDELLAWDALRGEMEGRAQRICDARQMRYDNVFIDVIDSAQVQIRAEYSHCGSCGTETEYAEIPLDDFVAGDYLLRAKERHAQEVAERKRLAEITQQNIARQAEERERAEFERLKAKYRQ